jgi:hypothetical protein
MKKSILLILSLVAWTCALPQESAVSFSGQMALGSSLVDGGSQVAIHPNGQRIIFGIFGNDLDFDPGSGTTSIDPLGNPDLFLASYAEDQSLSWVINLGRIGLNDGMGAGGMVIDSEGNIIVAGYFSLTVDFDPSEDQSTLSSQGGRDAFIAKYSEGGTLIWAKSIGALGFDGITALAVDGNDDILLGLRFAEEVDADPNDGEFILTPQGATDAALVKLDTDGNLIWAEHFQPGENNEIITSIESNGSADIAMGAWVNGVTNGIPEQTMWVGIFDSEGNEIWSIDFQNQGPSNEVDNLTFSQDGESLYIGGRIQAQTDFDPGPEERIVNPLFADPYLAKYASNTGELEWVKWIESPSTEDYCTGIKEANGLVFMAGSFDINAIFVPDDFNTQVPSNGAADMYVSVYNADTGEFLEAYTYGGAGSELIRHAEFGSEGSLIVTGEFLNSLGLDEEAPISAQGLQDILFGEFNYLYNLSSGEWQKEDEVKVYPVPSPERIFLELPDAVDGPVNVEVVNVVGQSVLSFDRVESHGILSFDISELKTGIYILEVEFNGSKVSKRLIKQ